MSAGDFLSGKITHAGKHTQLKLHALFEKKHLKVKYNDSIFSYLKKDVYGYVDKEGQAYRFFNNKIYPILNPHESILLYKKTMGTGMRNSPIEDHYFFSREAGTEILPLSLENLQLAFADNKAFTYILEIHFKNGDDLAEYDSLHNMYKLNRLLNISQKEKNN